MNFERGSENLLTQRRRALFITQGLKEEFDGLTNVGESFLYSSSLGLAPLQFRTPRVTSVFVLFDYHADLPRH